MRAPVQPARGCFFNEEAAQARPPERQPRHRPPVPLNLHGSSRKELAVEGES
jgi:hypothetical protein